MTIGPDGSVILSAQAVQTRIPRCDGACSYQAMEIAMQRILDNIHQIESGVLPPQVPKTAAPDPTPFCTPERWRLAYRLAKLPSWERQLRALELCPAEMCSDIGTRIMRSGNSDRAMAAARLCPHL